MTFTLNKKIIIRTAIGLVVVVGLFFGTRFFRSAYAALVYSYTQSNLLTKFIVENFPEQVKTFNDKNNNQGQAPASAPMAPVAPTQK